MSHWRKYGRDLPAAESEKYIRDLIAKGHFRVPTVGDTFLDPYIIKDDEFENSIVTCEPFNFGTQAVGLTAIAWVDVRIFGTSKLTGLLERRRIRLFWSSADWEANPAEYEAKAEARILRTDRSK